MRSRVTLLGFWLSGTAFAMLLAALAVQMAGARVTDPHRATISRPQVETELAMSVAQDATSTTVAGAEAAAGAGPAIGDDLGRDTVDAATPADPTRDDPSARATAPTTGVAGPGESPGGSPAPPVAPPITVDDHGGGGGGSSSDDPTITEPSHRSPGGPSTTQPPVPGPEQTFVLVGGSVTARCVGTSIQVVAAPAPADGFTTADQAGGPVSGISVRFRSDSHESELKATCSSGTLIPEVLERDR